MNLFSHKKKELVFAGETIDHKLIPALGWAIEIGLVKQKKAIYELTNAGLLIAKMHSSFLEKGYQAFRSQAGKEIVEALAFLTKKRKRRTVSERVFEREIKCTIKEARRLLRSRRPIAIPLLRNVCCSRLLQKLTAINDAEFDDLLWQLSRTRYYEYSMMRSREVMVYPYPGIATPRGSFYYFNTIRA
jgi:hypothetical protein